MKLTACVAALVLGTAVSAQTIESIVGPSKPGLGHQVAVAVTNDTGSTIFVTGFYFVFDNADNLVFLNPPFPSPLFDGTSYLQKWNQTDGFGNPVPPGRYRVDVDVPDLATGGIKTESHFIEIQGNAPSVGPLAVPRIGKTRSYQLNAPNHPNATYLLAASATATTGIPTCGGNFPLDADALLLASLRFPSTFQGFFGTLNGQGISTAPALALPPDPTLSGLNYNLAFAVIDPLSPCPVTDLSAVEPLTLR